jgi:dynein heavy chain
LFGLVVSPPCRYLTDVKATKIHEMNTKVKEAGERLQFILEVAELSEEDVALNTALLHWPKKLEPVFDVGARRVDEHKATAERVLKEDLENHEQLLKEYVDFLSSTVKRVVVLHPAHCMTPSFLPSPLQPGGGS